MKFSRFFSLKWIKKWTNFKYDDLFMSSNNNLIVYELVILKLFLFVTAFLQNGYRYEFKFISENLHFRCTYLAFLAMAAEQINYFEM